MISSVVLLFWHGYPSRTYELYVAPSPFPPGGRPLRVDLDIDSDNNNGFDPPARSFWEDFIEDFGGLPGKIIFANEPGSNRNMFLFDA
jgi:hypothetical protein